MSAVGEDAPNERRDIRIIFDEDDLLGAAWIRYAVALSWSKAFATASSTSALMCSESE